MSTQPSSPPPGPYISAADHFQDYLDGVYLLVKRYVGRHWHRMTQAAGTINDLYVSFHEARKLLRMTPPRSAGPVALDWPQPDDVERELDMHRARLAMRLRATAELSDQIALPIEDLRAVFGLDDEDLWLLVTAIAPQISVDIARLFTFAWSDFAIKQPTVGFLCELVAPTAGLATRLLRRFEPDAPLRRARLVGLGDARNWQPETPLLHKHVVVPHTILTALQGYHSMMPRHLQRCVRDAPRPKSLDELVYAEGVIETVGTALDRALHGLRGHPRLLLVGADGVGRRTLVSALLAAQQTTPLVARLGVLAHENREFESHLIELCREATLRRQVLLLESDELLEDTEKLEPMLPALASAINGHRGAIVLTARQSSARLFQSVDSMVEIRFEVPSTDEQRELWQRRLEACECGYDKSVPTQMIQRFNLTPGDISLAVEDASLQKLASTRKRSRRKVTANDVSRSVQRRLDHSLSLLAEPFSTSLGWEDVVFPEEVRQSLEEILARAEHKETVMELWGFREKLSYGLGLTCLFSGPPGTGKTMVSALLARSLGRQAYRIDLSKISSKWVGETEKNLGRVFDEAERAQIILLFDEADSLFGKRTDVKGATDRYANMEVNYLLQRMEAYDGMSILTTNFDTAIDEAFKRRIQFRVNFPLPEEDERLLLWKRMIPRQAKVDVNVNFRQLARDFEMAGGNIKNAVLRAAFYAATDNTVIKHRHLADAAQIEAREMGILVRQGGPRRPNQNVPR